MPFTGVKDVTPDWPTPNRVFDPARAHELYKGYVDTMVYAESCGFDWVGCNEHHFSPYGLMANCNLIGAALVYPTRKIRIAMMGNLVPLNNPIRIAEEYAMLDCMSGGRLVAGFGERCGNANLISIIAGLELKLGCHTIGAESLRRLSELSHFVYELANLPPRKSQAYVGQSAFAHKGGVHVAAVRKNPLTYEHIDPAAVGNIQRVLISDLALAKECIQVYREAARTAGWEPRPENILIGMHTVIAETDDEAKAALAEARRYFDGVLMGGMRTAGRLVLQKTRFYQDQANRDRMQNRLAKREASTMEQQIAGGMILCGSPESVVQQIRRIHAELGHGIFNFTMKVGDLPDAMVRRGMELFRDRVLPHVRDL